MPCRPIGPETKPRHGPVAIKWAVSGRWPNRLGRAEARINFHICIFSINFVFLIKNLFTIIKFELKLYDFTLNNVIENSSSFFVGSCRAVSG
jgi:hypothetical protein